MYCKNCGKQIDNENASFCNGCGSELNRIHSAEVMPVEGESTVILTKPIKRQFVLLGQVIDIDEEMDLFNTCRQQYKIIADEGIRLFQTSYAQCIHDFDSFIGEFLNMYSFYLEPIMKKTMDLLVKEGIWSITIDELRNTHVNNYHWAVNGYEVLRVNADNLLQEKVEHKAAKVSFIPEFWGIGLAGALTSTALNIVAYTASNQIMKYTSLKPFEKSNLYNQLNIPMLISHVYSDYMNAYLTLALIMKQNGRKIWYPTEVERARNMYANILNPYFPEEERINALISIIKMWPYDENIYNYMTSIYGEREDILQLRNYFCV